MSQTNGDTGSDAPSERAVTFFKADRAVDVTLKFGRERQAYTAKCVELGTSTFGDTPSEAEEAIVEAVALQLEALDEHGELERFLAESGVKIRKHQPAWLFAREPVPA